MLETYTVLFLVIEVEPSDLETTDEIAYSPANLIPTLIFTVVFL